MLAFHAAENVETAQTIEMHRNVAPWACPIHSSSHVVASQPHGQARQQRRPIPLNTLDWVSTPRSQLSALSGTHFLGNVEQLEIQQVVDLSTLLGRPERSSQYRVKVPKGETLFLAVQANSEIGSGPFSCLNLIRSHGNVTFNILDQCGEPAFVMRINSRWTFTLSKSHKITVQSAYLLGTVEENCNLMGASFTVYDDLRNQLCNIFGPNVCGCCMYKEAQFQVITNDGTHQIASLMHQWDNTLHDYILLITFPADTDIKLKSLLLAAAFLLVNTTKHSTRSSIFPFIFVHISKYTHTHLHA